MFSGKYAAEVGKEIIYRRNQNIDSLVAKSSLLPWIILSMYWNAYVRIPPLKVAALRLGFRSNVISR